MKAPGLPPCPPRPNCVCSDADPGDPHHVHPLALAMPAAEAWRLIRQAIEAEPRARIVANSDHRLRAEYRSRIFRFVDELELQLRADERVIAVRSASRIGYSDFGVNRRRVERLRARLRKRGVVH